MLICSHVIRLLMAAGQGKYEPAVRCGHVAAAVEDKVYVWGGRIAARVSHDGPDKTGFILIVHILDVKVRTDPSPTILILNDSLPNNDCQVAPLCSDQKSSC